jgi:hypothetical protein
MLTFFKRFRQALLSENKISKYLLYAIGEIILVVIGILIAIQVNNWNEARKERRLADQLIEVLITDLNLKKRENISDLAYGESIIQKSGNIINTWKNEKKIDTTNLKFVVRILGEDDWFYNENSPVYSGLSGSDLWKQLPDSLTTQIDNVYRLNLARIKKQFEKSSEYATHCKLNFLLPNNLIELDMSAGEISEILSENEQEFISHLELFRSRLFLLNITFKTSAKSIEKLTGNLESYRKSLK